MGRVDANQACVPLGNRGDLVSLEPRSIPITARLATESLTMDIRGAELRADRPRRHQQVEAGKRELKLSYTGVLSNCQFASYSLRLVLPDGSIVEASDRGESLTLDSFSVFPVSDRPAGAYTVRLGGGFLNSTLAQVPEDLLRRRALHHHLIPRDEQGPAAWEAGPGTHRRGRGPGQYRIALRVCS